MFDSGIKVSDLIESLRLEVDMAPELDDLAYITILNAVEQLLYTEIIQEQGEIIATLDSDKRVDIEKVNVAVGEAAIRFEDIYTVYAGETQLMKSTLTSGSIFPNTFYKDGNKVGFSIDESEVKIIYFVKPALKTVGTKESDTVKLPIEFIELAKAKMRGEAYKIANEDELAAKWLNDYNVLLETFKVWIANRAPQFGM